jgi:hypothetical protein
MTEKRMPHLKWKERRPPLLAFESYALLEKVQPAQGSGKDEATEVILEAVEQPNSSQGEAAEQLLAANSDAAAAEGAATAAQPQA